MVPKEDVAAIIALADTGGASTAFANIPEDASGIGTIKSKTNFLRAVREGTITATAKPHHVGRSTIVAETEVQSDAGKLIAKITQMQSV